MPCLCTGAAIVVAVPFRAAIRDEILRHVVDEQTSPDVRDELVCFARHLAGTGRLPLPESRVARQAVVRSVALAVRRATERGDWRTVVALASLVDAFVHDHGLESPRLAPPESAPDWPARPARARIASPGTRRARTPGALSF